MNYRTVSRNANTMHRAGSARGSGMNSGSELGDDAAIHTQHMLDYTRHELDNVLKIHEYERERLGQELHDSTGQLVISLLLGLRQLRTIGHDDGNGSVIEDIEQTARQIEREIRSLAFLHYPAELGDRSLCSSLEHLALGFGRRTGIDITFQCAGEIPPVGELVSIALLRIAQEALVNVHRHAHATSAQIKFKRVAGHLRLQISDDGIGMPEGDPSTSGGIGMKGMRHRVEANGGRFELHRLNPGVMICATIPLPV